MRWDRWRSWRAGDRRWRFDEIDTTTLSPRQAAAEVVAWCRRALRGSGEAGLSGGWADAA